MSRLAARHVAAGMLVVLGLVLAVGCREDHPGAIRAAATAPVRDQPVAAPTVPEAAAAPARPGLALPTVRPRPRYLTQSYRAPQRLVASGAGGTLRIPSLGVVVPVDAVGLDGTAMALPDNPRRIGWLRTSAAVGDRIGSSVVSGHVSDHHDVPGALNKLKNVRRGAVIFWAGVRGRPHRFVVTAVHRYPRSVGVPARIFRVDGPHLLHLVTCTDRQRTSGGGFHYRSNLVVTAREISGR